MRLDADSNLNALLEAMDHGRDGYPRWIVIERINSGDIPREAERIGASACNQGFVPLEIDTYMRRRILGDTELDERSLLLVDMKGQSSRAHSALLDAAARSPRPHVLLTFGAIEKPAPQLVREARAAYAARATDRDSPQVIELVTRAQRASEFAACGRHAAAERLLRDVIAALARRGAFVHASRLSMTLGEILNDRGRLPDAFAALESAINFGQSVRCAELVVEGRIRQATIRIAEARFVEAEALCRAVLEGPGVGPALRAWTHAVLADALLWQGRVEEAPEIDVEKLSGLHPRDIAEACEVKTRVLLAKGETFEAGACAARLKAFATESAQAGVHVIAQAADLAVVAAAGDLPRASEVLDALLAAVHAARFPLRDSWARLVWIDAARRVGDHHRTRSHLSRLQRVEAIAPALLRREIRRRLSTSGATSRPAMFIRFAAVVFGVVYCTPSDGAGGRGRYGGGSESDHTRRRGAPRQPSRRRLERRGPVHDRLQLR